MENKLLLNLIEDRFERFQKTYSIVTTDFLDLSQQSCAGPFLKTHRAEGVFLYGGYEDADRRQIVFVPDYLGIESEDQLTTYFRENVQDCPMVVLDVTAGRKDAELGNSDYLGSLLALGIRREKTGDIIVRPGGAQILVNREIAPYLAENYSKAGRISLKTQILPISELKEQRAETKVMRLPVSSARLDNIISAVFGISRKSASEAINRGIVFVNDMEMKKPDHFLKGGEKIVLRGKGKAIYKGSFGTSRKGKIYAEFDRYI